MRWSLTLIFIASGYFASILIFQRGLLLKRHIVAAKSTCADVILRNSTSCWMPTRFKRAVVLVVDALRYDFIEPPSSTVKISHFTGQMPLVAELLSAKIHNGKRNAQLFKFISDAPTTTFQRIKAFVTGNIPTFIEASENFGASEIREDNLIDQFISTGRNVTFLGDDTWTQLLPRRFVREFSMPSFDIKDLDTVDNMVIGTIYDEIDRLDWNLLIAHVLGVDHCGHRYSPDHPEMRRKLRQTDELIFNITNHLAEDTLLVVMGDHGMTDSGDHGGESRTETEAALFVYSKAGWIIHANALKQTDEVEQIDIVPTLSLLMGFPIPFSSIGRIIESMFDPEQLSTSLKLNAIQVVRYAQEYARFESGVQISLWPILRAFDNAPSDSDPVFNRQTVENVQRVLRNAFQAADMPMALIGVFSLVECIFFNFYAGFSILEGTEISVSQYVFRSALFLLQLSLYFGADMEANSSGRVDLLIFSVLTIFTSLLYTLSALFMRLFFKRVTFFKNLSEFTYGVLLVIQAFSFSSNSYVINEPFVLHALMASFFVLSTLNSLVKYRSKKSNSVWKYLFESNYRLIFYAIFVLNIMRSFNFFRVCREENIDCDREFAQLTEWFGLNLLGSSVQGQRAFRVFVAIGVLFATNFFAARRIRNKMANKLPLKEKKDLAYHAIRIQSSNSINLEPGHSNLIVFGLSLSWLMCIGVTLHWLCEHIEQVLASRGAASSVTELYGNGGRRIAQFVYFLCIIFYVAAIFVRHSTHRSLLFATHRQIIGIVLAMILGDWFGISLCLIMIIFFLMDEFLAESGVFTRAIFVYILGTSAFYALGHQCTLNSIPWNAAFVGLTGNFSIKAVAAALVLLHLFAGNVLAIFSMFSSTILPKKALNLNSLEKVLDISYRAEVLLFLAFNGIRVLGSCVACVTLRHHLMFFKIFAPKFVFEAINLLVCCVVVTFLGLFICSRQVSAIFIR